MAKLLRNAVTRVSPDSFVNREKVLELYDSLLIRSHEPAVTFFGAAERQFIPALRQNNTDEAKQIFASTMKPAYDKHRAAIDEAVQLAKQYNQAIEAVASREGNRFSALFTGMIVMIAAGFGGLGFSSIA